MPVLGVIMTFWFVLFGDKGGSDQVALSAEAQALRIRRGIIIDSLDYAVCPVYLDSLRKKGARVCHTTRWLNGATIEAEDATAEAIKQLPFVTSVEATRLPQSASAELKNKWFMPHLHAEDTYITYHKQLEVMNLPALHARGYKGQGVPIAVIDGGFMNLQTLTMFDSIRQNGRLAGMYDFADDPISFCGEDAARHGSMCLGLIAGNREDYQGAATQATFYVLRSEEMMSESPKEPDNWVAAVEKCDSLGVWIASTSLGYYAFDNKEWNYTYSMLDGKTTRASRAAHIAARKGMLLCLAAGNTGHMEDWPWINTPADADSVLTVGAVDKDSTLAYFSSQGPTADGRIKPEVCAMGYEDCLVEPNNDGLTNGNGTSFATPLLAGLAACLWSAFPNETNMQIRERIIRSAHLLDKTEDRYGYGIPDAWKAYANKPGAVESLGSVPTASRKILRNGKLIIIRDNAEYDILGNKQ